MPLLYVAENTLGKIDVYDARKYEVGPVAEITDGVSSPVGLCIGANGVLYVLNNGSDSISENEPGQTAPFQTITDGLSFPEFCAIDRRGNLWVTNLGYNSVTEYKKGATSPSRTITSGVSLPTGTASSAYGDVEEYRAGQGQPYQTISKMNSPADVPDPLSPGTSSDWG